METKDVFALGVFVIATIYVIATIVFMAAAVLAPFTASTQDIESEPPHYPVTPEERETLARLVYLEASICGPECQRAIASVVFNRLEAGYWGDTLEEVIYYPNAFTPAHLIASCERPPQAIYDTVDYVLQNGSTMPSAVRYFRTNHDFSWDGYVHYATYDNIYFGYFTNGNH